jgi:hypothetical protein
MAALTTRLPPELLLRVFDFVDPPAIVDLACSSKFLEKCSRSTLRKHRALHARYRVVTDAAPQSLTDLLRKALIDHQIAWHVRELEFTRHRTQWSQWKGSDDIEEVENTEMSDSSPPPDYAFTQDEQTGLLNQLREIFHFDEEQIENAYTDLQHGNDAPLKLLLLGACPRIRSVKFTRHGRISGRCTIERASPNDVHDNPPRSGLEYFHQAIIIHLQNNSKVWPAGFDSLQDLAIGVAARDETTNLAFAPSPLLFANCMHLPHLISLYCFGLRMNQWEVDDQDNTGARYEIEERSSSVQGIFLDGAMALHEPMEGIISGCRQLKSLTIAGSELNNVDAVVYHAGNRHGQSLETMMFYDTSWFEGYRCAMFKPEEIEKMTQLRMMYFDASDVMLDAFGECDDDAKCDCAEHDHEWTTDHAGFTKFCMNTAFPSSTEVLVLETKSDQSEGDAKLLDEALTTMIEYGRVAECDDDRKDGAADSSAKPAAVYEKCYPNLKAIYLGSLDETNETNGRRKRRFSKAIAAGRKFGVDVHTRTTRGRPFHQIDFPKPPTWASLKPAEESLEFDIYTGSWAPAKCGNCGSCEACLWQYDASMWKEVEDELERKIA